jgi:hypothetical protein
MWLQRVVVAVWIAAIVIAAISVHWQPIPSRFLLLVVLGGLLTAFVAWVEPRLVGFTCALVTVFAMDLGKLLYPKPAQDSWLAATQASALVVVSVGATLAARALRKRAARG